MERSGNSQLAWLALTVSFASSAMSGFTLYETYFNYSPHFAFSARFTNILEINPSPDGLNLVAMGDDEVAILNDGNRPLYIDSVTASMIKLPPYIANGIAERVEGSEDFTTNPQILALPRSNFGSPVAVSDGKTINARGIVIPASGYSKQTWRFMKLVPVAETHSTAYAWLYSFMYFNAKGVLRERSLVASVILFKGDPKAPKLGDFETELNNKFLYIMN